jgi:hypothetical protein
MDYFSSISMFFIQLDFLAFVAPFHHLIQLEFIKTGLGRMTIGSISCHCNKIGQCVLHSLKVFGS